MNRKNQTKKAASRTPADHVSETLCLELDQAFPAARSRDVVRHKGSTYECRYFPLAHADEGKTVTAWGHTWVEVIPKSLSGLELAQVLKKAAGKVAIPMTAGGAIIWIHAEKGDLIAWARRLGAQATGFNLVADETTGGYRLVSSD